MKNNKTFIKLILVPIYFIISFLFNQVHAQETATERANHAVAFHQSGEKAWESIAPGFMNVTGNVIINGDTITVLIDIGGLLQSTDRGQTWKTITYSSPSGMTNELNTDFDIHPTNSQLMIIAGNGMFRTEDGGTVWEEVNSGLPNPAWGTTTAIYGQVRFNSTGSTIFTALGSNIFGNTGWESSLASYHSDKFIYTSTDLGVSWSKKIIESGNFSIIRKIYTHPTRPDIAYVSFIDGTFYLIENADNTAISFSKVTIPSGLFVRSMEISPNNINEMMLTLSSINKSGRTSHLYRGINSTSPSMTLSEIPIGTFPGLRKEDFLSVGYNSALPNQIVIGDFSSKKLLITEDDGVTFNTATLPDSLYTGYNQTSFYGNIERVWFGKNNENYAIVASKIGMWITEDNFNSFQDLTMEEEDGYLGNKGVGSPANINAITITDSNIYFSAQDHKAFKTKEGDYTKWKNLLSYQDHPYFSTQTSPWGQIAWHQKTEKIFASNDEKYLYVNCLAYVDASLGFLASKKIFRSTNKGTFWVDVTANFGLGSIYPSGDEFVKILFDSNDSDKHWVVFGKKLYYTQDGGATFTELSSPLFPSFSVNDYQYTDIVYDDTNNIIYLSVGHRGTKLWTTVLTTDQTLYKSVDGGTNWSVVDVGQNDIQSLGVKADGTLFIGTGKTGPTPAHFIVLPFNTPYTSAHIKMTIADVPEERRANQLRFAHIKVSGDDILVYSGRKWAISDRFYAQGPYLSRDGGNTFKFIQWDLPHNNIWSLDMKDGVVVIGTTFGVMRVDLDSIDAKTAYVDTVSTCGPYTWIDGNNYTSSNTVAKHTIINPNGFDSIVTLNLTINQPTTGTDTQTACSSYTWIDGNNYTSSNTSAMHTLTNSAGCDSIITLNLTVNNPTTPIVIVSGSTSLCAGSTVDLTSSNLTGNTWTTGVTTETITVGTSGSYSVTFTDVNGCSATSSPVNITLTPLPSAPTVTVTDNCGSSVLTASGTGLLWSTGETTSSITVTTGGTYTVTQTVAGCTSANGSGVANPTAIPTAPTVAISDNCGSSTLTTSGTNLLWSTGETTSSITVTTGGTYTVTQTVAGCTSANGSGVANPTAIPSAPTVAVADNCGSSILTVTGSNLLWSTGETTSSITVTTAGTYTVTQTVAGCTSANGSGISNPNVLPSAPTVTTNGSTSLCTGDSVVLTSSELTGNVWSNGMTTNSITVNSAGTYTVTYTNASGCSVITSGIAVTVNPLPLAPVITTSGATTFCEGNSVDLASSQVIGNDWSTTETTQTITVSNSGSYTVTYTDGNSCSATSSPMVVTVNPLPVVTISALDTVCANYSPVTLTQGFPSGGTYSGTSVSGNTFDPSVGIGTYAISYSFTDANGCTSVASQDVVVDGCASLMEFSKESISIYPNPTFGEVTITSKGGAIESIKIYDATGRIVRDLTVGSQQKVEVDMSEFSSGVYNIEIRGANSIYRTQLFKN